MIKIGSNLTKCALVAALTLSAGLGSTYGMKNDLPGGGGSGKPPFDNKMGTENPFPNIFEAEIPETFEGCIGICKKIWLDQLLAYFSSLEKQDLDGAIPKLLYFLKQGYALKFPREVTESQLKAIFNKDFWLIELFGGNILKISFEFCQNIKNLDFLHPPSLPNLEGLDVSFTNIDNISGVEEFANLKEFSAVCCQDLKTIIQLAGCQKLTSLGLYQTEVAEKELQKVWEGCINSGHVATGWENASKIFRDFITRDPNNGKMIHLIKRCKKYTENGKNRWNGCTPQITGGGKQSDGFRKWVNPNPILLSPAPLDDYSK